MAKTYHSEINGDLHVYWSEDRKLLDTKNTNYSYGTLQEVLNRGLRLIPIDKVESVLVLGMGGGCVVDSLRHEFRYEGPITGVELDAIVIEIAEKEFNLLEDGAVRVVESDADDYLTNLREEFDLVVVDIFIDTKVPPKFYTEAFWKKVERVVSKNGFALFNAGIDLTDEEIKSFIEKIPQSFIYTKKLNVLVSNTVFIFQKVF